MHSLGNYGVVMAEQLMFIVSQAAISRRRLCEQG
jgi:hypothetical protein